VLTLRPVAKLGPAQADTPALTVPDVTAWRAWLEVHYTEQSGVWLTLAKKGQHRPTALSYDEALEEALCFGWIDGQARGGDATSYKQRFTPRRRRSQWSKRNTEIVESLVKNGRIHASGIAEMERAKADGRWEAAYSAQSQIDVPDDLATELRRNPRALAMFDILSSQNRYAVLYRVSSAKRAGTRARRIEQFVDMLARGETVYPQRRKLDGG